MPEQARGWQWGLQKSSWEVKGGSISPSYFFIFLFFYPPTLSIFKFRTSRKSGLRKLKFFKHCKGLKITETDFKIWKVLLLKKRWVKIGLDPKSPNAYHRHFSCLGLHSVRLGFKPWLHGYCGWSLLAENIALQVSTVLWLSLLFSTSRFSLKPLEISRQENPGGTGQFK